jgi:hypothetical protein
LRRNDVSAVRLRNSVIGSADSAEHLNGSSHEKKSQRVHFDA